MTPFRTALESPAVADALKERRAQIEKHGHDPLVEREAHPYRIAQIAAEYAAIARDRAQPGVRQDLAGARKKAVQAAALQLAQIDVLDHHINALAVEAYEREQRRATAPDLPGLEP